MTLSEDISKSIISIALFPCLAERIAASLHKLAIYAPLNPGDKEANLLAYSSCEYFEDSFKGFR